MLSSLIKGCNPKKLLPVREQRKLSLTDNASPQKHAAVDLLERKQETIATVVVTEKTEAGQIQIK